MTYLLFCKIIFFVTLNLFCWLCWLLASRKIFNTQVFEDLTYIEIGNSKFWTFSAHLSNSNSLISYQFIWDLSSFLLLFGVIFFTFVWWCFSLAKLFLFCSVLCDISSFVKFVLFYILFFASFTLLRHFIFSNISYFMTFHLFYIFL